MNARCAAFHVVASPVGNTSQSSLTSSFHGRSRDSCAPFQIHRPERNIRISPGRRGAPPPRASAGCVGAAVGALLSLLGGVSGAGPLPQGADVPSVTQVSRAGGLLERFRKAAPAAEPTTSAAAPTRRVSTSFVTAAVRAVGAAVVRIDTERTVHGPMGVLIQPGQPGDLDPLLEDPVLKRFFGDYYGNGSGNGLPGGKLRESRPQLMRGQGSGFIIDKAGLLITNAHVVKGADKVTVTLTDGRSFIGQVRGTDELLDLAVVKIDPRGKPLPVAPLGVSGDLQVGDWVIAVGNPVGLDNTVTLGIVSSLNRSSTEVGIPEMRLDLIQTSAPLNLGNSGGPLLNEFGEVVGINTAVRTNAEAIGFAIPIDRAKTITAALAQGKQIEHAFVGIQMMNVTPEVAKQNNGNPNAAAILPERNGALVVRVVPASPAAEAGLRRYDIIVAIDGEPIRNVKQAQSIVDRSSVGQLVSMKVVRGDAQNVLDIKVKTGDLATIQAGKAVKSALEG